MGMTPVGGAPRGDALETSSKPKPIAQHTHVLHRDIPFTLNIIAAQAQFLH